MAIWVNNDTRLVVQGITGKEGTFHALGCRDYGTKVVAGVTPGKGGETVEGIPVFDTVAEAARGDRRQRLDDLRAAAVRRRRHHGSRRRPASSSWSASPRAFRSTTCCKVKAFLRDNPTRLIGPNCPGVISPGMAKIGIMPGHIHKQGRIGVVSPLGHADLRGRLAALEPRPRPVDLRRHRRRSRSTAPTSSTCSSCSPGDPDTDGVVMIGEIGGSAEEEAAAWIQANYKKPVVGFIAGRTAPPGRRMGHAGAIIAGGKGTAAEKFEALKAAGIHVVESPAAMGETMKKALGK